MTEIEHTADCTCNNTSPLFELMIAVSLCLRNANDADVKALRKCGLMQMAYDTQELINYKSPCACATEAGTCNPCLARDGFVPCPLHFDTKFGCPTCGPELPTKQEIH